MKKWFIIGGIISLFSIAGCQSDPCQGIECQNGGVCVDGDCDCPQGFTGLRCEVSIDPCLLKGCDARGSTGCTTTVDGVAVCNCRDGYQGNLCNELWSDPYLRNYVAVEDCEGANANYAMRIEEGPQFQSITFFNFHNEANQATAARVVAYLLTSRAFEIREQFMTFGRVDGVGTRDQDGTVRLSYTIIQSGDTLSCSAILQPN